MSVVRRAYLDLGAIVVELLGRRDVGDRWADPSALSEFSIGTLAAHLARAILQVGWYLEMPEPEPPATSAAEYYASLEVDTGPASDLNVAIRLRAEETAAPGWARLFLDVRNAHERLVERLEQTPPQRRLLVFGGRVLVVDEYLKTRVVEMTVHIDDLTRSLGIDPPQLPLEATTQAIAVLVGSARLRHGDLSVLRALTRRELDSVAALRVI